MESWYNKIAEFFHQGYLYHTGTHAGTIAASQDRCVFRNREFTGGGVSAGKSDRKSKSRS